ncbi:protein MEI2-like 1 [Impatiens glandulifera]|uniref:protein MEI2-like 1 n=1 Tax=Impatiens glandulifera TaxID=253017 RepID=UPI001FB14F11|nr:protein MEI2-like 1 [Impatiens glandulifera]
MKLRREDCTFSEDMSSPIKRNISSTSESLFQMSPSSSSQPITFGRKLGLWTNNIMIHESVDTSSPEDGEGHLANAETVEVQALQNLLPDEDDLFSGMIDEMVYNGNEVDDFDDFDLFGNCGGMELEVDKLSLSPNSSGRVLNGLETCTGSLENRSIHFLHSARYMSEVGLNKYQTSGRSISTTESTLASPVRTPSFGTCIGLPEGNHSLDQLGNQCPPRLHPFSVPDSCIGIGFMNSHTTSDTVIDMAGKIAVNNFITESGNHPRVMASTNQDIEFHTRVPGLIRNGNCLASEQYQADTNLYWNNHSTPLVWPNSSSGYPQLTGHPGMPIGNLNKVSHPHYPCVGSAPSASWSLLDRKNAHKPEFPQSLSFCSNSFGNGLINHPSLHLLGRDSGGKCSDLSTTNAWCNPHLISHNFSNTTGISSVPNSFSSPPKCVKNLSQRRSHGGFPQADIKQFELDIDRVLHGEDYRTTLMIKNIPNKYTSKMLLDVIDEQCQGKYDFIYLPIDFKNNCNVGYAFINLIDPLHIIPFYKAFNGRKWDKFNSEKMVALAYARIQGKTALIGHFQNSSLMNEDKRCRPILFCTNGPNAGEQEAFPSRASGRGKSGKARSSFMEENENRQQQAIVH